MQVQAFYSSADLSRQLMGVVAIIDSIGMNDQSILIIHNRLHDATGTPEPLSSGHFADQCD
jgi:hypothetical protein